MVNTGLPSRDCHTCRRRRVKCDLRRPGCYRCEKIGQECTGYRDLENRGLVFRVHTPSSYVARKQQKTCERSSVTSEEQSNANQNHSLEALDANWAEQGYPEERLSDLYRMFRSSPWSPSPSRQLLESWDMHIIPLIVSQFSFPRPGGGRVYGSLECFPHLLQHVETDSVLYLACHAVGYAYLANKSRTSGTALSHQSRYGRALYALRLALRDPELQKRDSTLLAVWLLCFYELVKEDIEDSKVGPVNYDIHSKALVGLLRIRGRQQFRSKTGCQVFQLAYHTIQINSIQTRCDPPSEAPQWFAHIQASDSVTNVNFIPLFSLCDDAVRISSTAKALAEKAALEDMFFGATFVAEASKDLESRMQDHFGQIVTLPSMNSAGEFIVVNNHINIHNLRIRNYVDACFLRLHYSVLELLFHTAKFQSHSIDQFEEITALRDLTILQTQARSERILSTLPIFLLEPSHQTEEEKGTCISNWADALRLLWQVRLIAASPFVLERQKMAAKSALSKIGHEIGLMQALGSYYLTLTAYISL